MDAILQQLWNAGIPLFLLVVAIIVVWQQWRADIAVSNKQRDAMVDALTKLTERIEAVLSGVAK